jgi:hypothetical protein
MDFTTAQDEEPRTHLASLIPIANDPALDANRSQFHMNMAKVLHPSGSMKDRIKSSHVGSKWVGRYQKMKQNAEVEAAQMSKERAMERRKTSTSHFNAADAVYRMVSVTSSHRLASYELPPLKNSIVPCEVWGRTRQRHSNCLISGRPVARGQRAECEYCPAVASIQEVKGKFRKQYRRLRKTGMWVCPDCEHDVRHNVEEIRKNKKEKEDQLAKQAIAIWAQRLHRAYAPKRGLVKAKKAALVLAKRIRGMKERKEFNSKFASEVRPFKIKIIDASMLKAADKEGTSDPYVHVAVFDRNGRQIFSCQTNVEMCTLNPIWQQLRLVPGASGNVTLVFTVIDEDALKNDFLGQASIQLKGTNVWRVGGHFDLSLGPMEFIPLERKQPMRLGSDDFEGQGMLKLQVIALPMSRSRCGLLEQRENSTPTLTKRKWWAVLTDCKLQLYRFYGEGNIRECIVIQKGVTFRLKKLSAAEVGKGRCPHLIILEHGIHHDHHYTFAPESKMQAALWLRSFKEALLYAEAHPDMHAHVHK